MSAINPSDDEQSYYHDDENPNSLIDRIIDGIIGGVS